jgi:hypothetical protein
LKILPRSRRTRSSQPRQSTRSQASPSNTALGSSGPFTEVSNLSLSSSIRVHVHFKGPPAHVSTLNGLRAPGSISGQLAVDPSGGSSGLAVDGFLVPFGRRHSLLGHPVPPGVPPPLRSAYRSSCAYPRTFHGPIAGFPRSACVRPGPGRALSLPRGRRCSQAIGSSVAAACRLSTTGPCHPGTASQPGMLILRGIIESSLVVAPPALPLACGRHGWGGGPWTFP